jgi:hypothetical protein
MRILIFGDTRYREVLVKKIVANGLANQNNIIGFEDIYSIEDFFVNSTLGKGVAQHIDLVIADDVIAANKYQSNLCEWLRGIDDAFSGGNFRLSSIPMILCKRDIIQSENSASLYNATYNATLPFSEDDRDLRIILKSRQLVKAWRKEVLNDLSTLDIDPKVLEAFGSNFKSVFTHYSRFSKDFEYYFSRTKIISKDFIRSPKTLDYAWMSENKIIEIERSLDQYVKIIKDLERRNKKAFERPVLHRFYNQYKFFLARDIFDEPIYEKRYYVSTTTSAYHIPDFTLPAAFPGFTATSISEIKRHDIFFEYDPKHHQYFTPYTLKALMQASSYQDDFEAAGLFANKFQMDLVIGLDERCTEFIRRKLSKHFSTINVTTHNELIAMVEDYYKRLRSLHATIKS